MVNYSKLCVTCSSAARHNRLPKLHKCPLNYNGSSKGMEASAAAQSVKELFYNANLCVRRYVMDDDATTKSKLRHSYKDLIASGRMDKEDWPKCSNGRKKPDKGELPIDHPVIDVVKDKNHRKRCFAEPPAQFPGERQTAERRLCIL